MQAVTITKTQGPKMSGEPTAIDMEDLNRICYTTRTTMLSDKLKLTALFEPRNARCYGGISFETRRSMGGSIATSFLKMFVVAFCKFSFFATF